MERKDVFRMEGNQEVLDYAEFIMEPEEIDIMAEGMKLAMVQQLNDIVRESDPELRATKMTEGFKLLDTFGLFTGSLRKRFTKE